MFYGISGRVAATRFFTRFSTKKMILRAVTMVFEGGEETHHRLRQENGLGMTPQNSSKVEHVCQPFASTA